MIMCFESESVDYLVTALCPNSGETQRKALTRENRKGIFLRDTAPTLDFRSECQNIFFANMLSSSAILYLSPHKHNVQEWP